MKRDVTKPNAWLEVSKNSWRIVNYKKPSKRAKYWEITHITPYGNYLVISKRLAKPDWRLGMKDAFVCCGSETTEEIVARIRATRPDLVQDRLDHEQEAA